MSELGQEFNKRIDYSENKAELFQDVFERLVGSLKRTTL